jgi:hypothetical protein
MSDLGLAVLSAAIFSLLICLIEIKFLSKAWFKACITASAFFYLLILLVGNAATTLLAAATISAKSPAPLALGFKWFWYAFIGVFAFEALLQNINLTFVGKGVLSINDWISKARDNAVASAIDSQTNAGLKRAQQTANKLKLLSEQELNTHVLTALSADRLKELQNSAQTQNADVRLLLALSLAYNAPEAAAAIVS